MTKHDLHQDPEGFNARSIAVVGVVSVAIGLVAVGVAALLTPWARLVPTAKIDVDRHSAVAGVEQGPLRAFARGEVLRSRSMERINALGWTDREARLAHIPIDRAMDMIASGCRPPFAGETGFDRPVDAACSTVLPPSSLRDETPSESRVGGVPHPLQPAVPHAPAEGEER